MEELTKEQIKRQDHVDNAIFELMQLLNPTSVEIEWNIEMIGEVREAIKYWLVEHLRVCDESSFYPYL